MTITFFSNFMNIHQLPFCEELMKHIGTENFKFVATRRMDPDRVQMGFEDMNITKPFVVREYEDEAGKKEALRLAAESDVVIFGSAPVVYLYERMKLNKLTFKYNERILKRGDWMLLHPVLHKSICEVFTQNKTKNFFVLCASAYTQRDLALFGFPKEKCFKWGYFPEVRRYDSFEQLTVQKKSGLKRPGVSILWVARLIGLKHPEIPVYVAEKLKKIGVDFELNMIGEGPERENISALINKKQLDDKVHLLGARDHSFVLGMMEKSDVFLFTSDRHEGWGAVLNEAMNAGCAIVADKAIGSVPFLVNNKVNGYIYRSRRQAVKYTRLLASDKDLCLTIGRKAWETANNTWDIASASSHLLDLFDFLIRGGKGSPICDGPCSMV